MFFLDVFQLFGEHDFHFISFAATAAAGIFNQCQTMDAGQMLIQQIGRLEECITIVKVAVVLAGHRRCALFVQQSSRLAARMLQLYVFVQLILQCESFRALGTLVIAAFYVPLHVLFEQRILIETARAHCAPEFEFFVQGHVLIEVGQLQEFLVTFGALERKTESVSFHMLLQLRLLLERLFGTLRAHQTAEAAVQ